MSEFALVAQDDIKRNDIVGVDTVNLTATRLPNEIAGGRTAIAKRNFTKGDEILFNDKENTEDLLFGRKN